MPSLVVLIPAYEPGEPLVKLVQELAAADVRAVVVVNDGSGPDFDHYFDAVRAVGEKVIVLNHAVNLGKGAALKTGLNHCLYTYRDQAAVITVDADGQHLKDDILRVGDTLVANPNALVIGARQWEGAIPMCCKFGNTLTRYVMFAVIGCRLTDTQTGLRGIPPVLAARLLKLKSSGYEFELDMLITARHLGIPIHEEPIKTVYFDDNKSSHFNPLLDSVKIYFVLLRFVMASVATAMIDFAVFSIVYGQTSHIVTSQIAARAVAMVFSYSVIKQSISNSDRKNSDVFPKYLLVVLLSGCLSYGLIRFVMNAYSVGAMAAKLVAESIIFIAQFAVLREFILARKNADGSIES